jgi:hypothetical protein
MNMNSNDNASASISNMLDELDATGNENCDPFFMLDSMGPLRPIISSHNLPIPVRGNASDQALARLADAQSEFHNTRIRFHTVVRAPKPGSRHHMPLLGPQTHLTYNCWIAFDKYVRLYAGWKVRRRSCDEAKNQGVAKKRAQYYIDAVYTYFPAQQPLTKAPVATATLVGISSNDHIRYVAAASTTTISPATATPTMDGALVDTTNVVSSIKTAEHKPPVKTMPAVATGARPTVTAAIAVAATSTAGMNANQSPTPTAAPDGTTTIITPSHVFQYGDLVSFPVDHLTTPTTLKAIVLRVHPVNEHDDCGKEEDEDEDTQQVTVSTGPGERFIVPIDQLVLIRPLSITP